MTCIKRQRWGQMSAPLPGLNSVNHIILAKPISVSLKKPTAQAFCQTNGKLSYNSSYNSKLLKSDQQLASHPACNLWARKKNCPVNVSRVELSTTQQWQVRGLTFKDRWKEHKHVAKSSSGKEKTKLRAHIWEIFQTIKSEVTVTSMGHEVKKFELTPFKLEMNFCETYDILLDNFESFSFQVPP